MTSRRTGALLAASCAVGGCNVLVGLDDVNIVQGGAGGRADPAESGAGDGGGTSTSGAGAPGTSAPGGGGAATGPLGGAGGAGPSVPGNGDGGPGGESPVPSGGGGGGMTTSGGGGMTTSGGGATTSGGAGGGMPDNPCGDGMITAGEQCDDGGGAPGDGCSGACQVEPYYQCTVPGPSLCEKQEVRCADGLDGDGDGLADGQDPDCALPAYTPIVVCNAVRIYRSANAPLAIPDGGGDKVLSPIFVEGGFNVAHTAVVLDVTHDRAGDLDVALLPPFGPPRTLTAGNGGDGANYTETLFDPACATSVTAGSAPFQGCYKPESFLPANGQPAAGAWTLSVIDQMNGQSGSLAGWALILCSE